MAVSPGLLFRLNTGPTEPGTGGYQGPRAAAVPVPSALGISATSDECFLLLTAQYLKRRE